ncbi:MAG: glycerophosphoryl diester phosphodiesterase, partial [Nocardioidaceae bacterium]|nr:glycerophosphoryl diester phosphodiesterase [Nocardioidaceae bacterium]
MTSGPPPRTHQPGSLRPRPSTRARTRRPSTLSGTVIGAMVLALGVLLAPVRPASAVPACPTAMAHRGNAYSPGPTESSIGAFNAAFSSGSKWIESDARFTSDGVPVLMHDDTVDRTTTGTGTVARMTAAQFTALTMNDGQHPPTLDQALALLRGHPDRHMMMEVKEITVAQEPILLSKLVGLENQVYVNAFAPHLANIQRLKVADPLLTISLVTYSPVLPVPVGISGEDMEYTYVTSANVAQLHAAGMTVRAWVANSSTAWQSLRNMGVDAIMTNQVAAYVNWTISQCGATPLDQTAPSVTASQPGVGATVSNTLHVTGLASDDVGVDTVELLVDGVAVASSAAGADGAVDLGWNSATVPNGTHTLQLQARDTAGNLGHSEVVSVTVQNVDEEAPTSPTAVSGTWSSPSRVALTWSGATDNAAVTGYRVYRDGVVISDLDPTARSYTDTGVANLTTYDYVVTALDAAGHESAPSEAATVETGDDITPTAPSVTAVLSGTDAAAVAWSGSTDNDDVTAYRVYRNGTIIGTVDGSASSLLDPGLDDGVAYTYTVAAFDAAGNASTPGGPATVRTPDETAPSAPSTLTAVSGSQNVALSWTAATDNVGVTHYAVHRDGATLTTLAGTARSYTDGGLDATTIHRYYVTALDAAGLEGPSSNVVTRSLADTTPPAAPTGLARTVSGFTVRLTWKAATDNVGVTGYTVYRAGVAVGTTTTATTYTDSAAPPGKTYSYTVRARDAIGNTSAASAAVSATLPVDKTAPTAPT